jgi:hypothetical protein
MPPAEYEPATPESERPQIHALHHTATGIGIGLLTSTKKKIGGNKGNGRACCLHVETCWVMAVGKRIDERKINLCEHHVQGRPLGGASGALAPGADFEGAPKMQSPTGHTLIRSTVAW